MRLDTTSEQCCWSKLPSHLLSVILDALPDAHDVASAQATCRAWDQHQRRTTISLAVEGGQRFADGDVDAFAAHWRRRAAAVKHAAAILRSQPLHATSLHLDVQLSCNKLGVNTHAVAPHPKARGAARQLLLALPPGVVRLQLSEVFSTLPELAKALAGLKHLRHLHLEVSPGSLALLARSDELQSLHSLHSLTLASATPLSSTSGLCLKETFSIGRPLNNPACLPPLPPSLRSLSLTNLPLGPVLTTAILAACPNLHDLALDGCHADLRVAPFPWPRLQRLRGRGATLGASHLQLVQLGRGREVAAVDLHDARLYDHAACGVEYLSFTFARWEWTAPQLQSLDLQLHCHGTSGPWATYCNGPLGELFGRCYSPLTPQSTVVVPPRSTNVAIGAAAMCVVDAMCAATIHPSIHTDAAAAPPLSVGYRGTLSQLVASGMVGHARLQRVSLRVGASQVPALLASAASLTHVSLSADPGDVHLRLQLPRSSALQRLSLEGFVLEHVDLQSCLALNTVQLAVPHTQHLHRAGSQATASTSSSDGAESSSDEEGGGMQRGGEQPMVLLPPGVASLAMRGRVPTVVSEAPVGGAEGGAQEIVWDLRGLRGLRTLSLCDGNRALSACVRLPYTLRTLSLGDAWAPKALRAWAPRLQNLRELRLCNAVECPRLMRETLAQLPSLRTLRWD